MSYMTLLTHPPTQIHTLDRSYLGNGWGQKRLQSGLSRSLSQLLRSKKALKFRIPLDISHMDAWVNSTSRHGIKWAASRTYCDSHSDNDFRSNKKIPPALVLFVLLWGRNVIRPTVDVAMRVRLYAAVLSILSKLFSFSCRSDYAKSFHSLTQTRSIVFTYLARAAYVSLGSHWDVQEMLRDERNFLISMTGLLKQKKLEKKSLSARKTNFTLCYCALQNILI